MDTSKFTCGFSSSQLAESKCIWPEGNQLSKVAPEKFGILFSYWLPVIFVFSSCTLNFKIQSLTFNFFFNILHLIIHNSKDLQL